MSQKVTVQLDEKGIPAMGELVTQSVINAVTTNANALLNRGLVVVQFDYQEEEPQQNIIDDYGIITSMKYPYKPVVRFVHQYQNGVVLQVLMPK